MMHVKTEVRSSQVHGQGLFAKEDIAQGQLIYTQDTKHSLAIDDRALSLLPKGEQEKVKHYGYKDKHTGKWHLAHDDIRFCNHSANANITATQEGIIAKKNISVGEELLQDYSEFENLRDGLH